MDNDICSLVGITLIAGMNQSDCHVQISQLSLSLYLMAYCQIKLHHPLTSLAQTLDYVQVRRRIPRYQQLTLDHLLLKLTERKILRYISVDCYCEDVRASVIDFRV